MQRFDLQNFQPRCNRNGFYPPQYYCSYMGMREKVPYSQSNWDLSCRAARGRCYIPQTLTNVCPS